MLQDAGFVPSCASLLLCYAFSALTGLMIMEVNINTVCELGAGSTSMQVRSTATKRLYLQVQCRRPCAIYFACSQQLQPR